MSRYAVARVCACLTFFVTIAVGAHADEGYLRYPDIHGDRVVFSAEGDLWEAPASGGTARRLTTHVGSEYFPRFSPDGRWIAFTGQYDGNRDVYLVQAEGGEPVRLTWHPGRDEVVGWSPDGREIFFRSSRNHPHGNYEILRISVDGGDPTVVPIGRAARFAVDPASGTYAFNRTNRETSTWKRYRGGTAQNIWVGHPDNANFRPVTDFVGTDAMPMWSGGRIFFISDQGGTYNIWSIRSDGSDRRRHTQHEDWDARWPNVSPDGRIAYMLGGDIRVYDTNTDQDTKLAIDLPSERTLTRARYPNPGQYVTWFEISPDADRLAIVARGEIFSVPVDEGVTLPISGGSGSREKYATFDPKGEKIVYVTDAAREEEIHVVDAWGRSDPEIVKRAGKTGWHFPPKYSPDGEWLAFADQTQTLYVMKASGGDPQKVDSSEQEEIREYTWSPDGRYLAYTSGASTDEFGTIFVYDTKSRSTHRITGDVTMDNNPAWDPDGRYLYFISERTINPVLGNRDFQQIEVNSSKIYAVLLKADGENPFRTTDGLPPDDKDKKDKKDKKKDDDEEDEDAIEPIEIDFDGIERRIVEFPMSAGIYSGLAATSSHVYYFSRGVTGMNEEESDEPRGQMMMYDLEEKEAEVFLKGVTSYSIAQKADKIVVQKKRGELYVVGAGSAPSDISEDKVSLDDVVIELDPREEWEQIYYEGWRHMRDFYWDPGMAGIDWEAIRDQYATLLPRLSIRDDVRDLLGEIIGELNTSHTYVWGGDPGESPKVVPTGLLGADLVRDGDAYRIAKIYRGDLADLDRGPLDEPGVDVKEGDYIVAVNRRPFAPNRPFHASLEKLAGRQVLLSVNDRPSMNGARDVVVVPTPGERRLRYVDWVRANREYVAEKTGGKIGYIHVPNMGTQGMVEFNRWFYPQLTKEGMVVDVRWNGGGFVSQQLVERLRRPVVSFDRSRGGGVYTYPYRTLNGPFVVLLNEQAGSDGDIFPYAIQAEKLAPVIGQRSWGGVVGIRNDKRLVDGGNLTQPEFAWWDSQRGWAMENYGVKPDIEVINYPQDIARGVDDQLDRGIEEVLKLHASDPPAEASFSDPIPNKSRDAYRRELRQ